MLDAQPAPELAHEPSGAATIETYTVLHDRDGAPVRGLVIGRLDDGRRFLAVHAGRTAPCSTGSRRVEAVGRARPRHAPATGSATSSPS